MAAGRSVLGRRQGAQVCPPSGQRREPEEAQVRGRRGPSNRALAALELRGERLDWLPPVLAALDRPFVIERPDELRNVIIALADRLTSYPAKPDSEEPMS
ncbi:hypothetical protein [Nocardia beijingensis]|uniref:hypothetical protein n=1 Tax=Nocardia beijingensis TaxID=95162 RepID=UPI001E5CDA27|nr:hypothetical protein [Nocardia beijingensis]